MSKKNRIAFMVGIALLVLILVYSQQMNNSSSSIVAANFGGAFSLTNHLGEAVTEKDFENSYRLICPTELQKITLALKKLGQKSENITPLFITVDPERDTVETMKNYVALFHPRLVGLTGTPEQIRDAANAYKIYYAKAQDDTMNDYTMDHSSFIYFIDPDDNLLRIFKTEDTAEEITKFIEDLF